MIKALLFDFGQTLVDSSCGFRSAEKESQEKIFRDHDMESWEEFLANYRQIRKNFHENSIFSRRVVWEAVHRHHCRHPNPQRLEKWERDYWKIVESGTSVFPETENVLTELTTNYRLGLITNSQGQVNNEKHRLSQFPKLESFFDAIIVAGEAAIPPKPNPTPFLLCLEKLGVSPSEAIYVGDDWRIDICGSREVGIQPIWLKHHLVKRNWLVVETSTPIIISLEQLFDIEALCSCCCQQKKP
jgi:HAD superfamily hydrolase (TIGR01549 family)